LQLWCVGIGERIGDFAGTSRRLVAPGIGEPYLL